MELDRTTPGFERLVSADAALETIATGCTFTEGPLWNEQKGYLLWSDMPADKMRKWTPEEGVTIFRAPCGKSNGLTYDKQGRLVACEHANRRISRTESDGAIVSLATHYEGKRLNSPNDVVMKSDGAIYFSDPPYGLTAEFGVAGEQELDFQGVFRLSPDGETITLLVDDFEKPNGLAFSPDESKLYIDDTDLGHIRIFDVRADGKLSGGKLFAELEGDEPGGCDGLKIDVEGNIYCTGPGGIHVLDPDGNVLGRMRIPAEHAANLAWGDSDRKSLYITAVENVYRIRMNIAGIPVL